MNKEDLKRLQCGCLTRCTKDGNNIWIPHEYCNGEKNCYIENYIEKHKPCLICGVCTRCFPNKHKNCNKWYRGYEKVINWLLSKITDLFFK